MSVRCLPDKLRCACVAQVEQELRAINVRFGALHGAANRGELDLFGRCIPAAAPPAEPEPQPLNRQLSTAGASRLRRVPSTYTLHFSRRLSFLSEFGSPTTQTKPPASSSK